MVAIKLAGFTGEQPRLTPRLLPDSGAQAAIDCRLDDGALTPVRAGVSIGETVTSGSKTIYRFGNEWLAWSDVVHAAPGPVDDTRLYFTGDGAPKMRTDGTTYDLAVPRPTDALTATMGGTGDGDVVTRAYVYTWVTDFGEESEPNPASNLIDWQPGNTVTLSGFASPPDDRAISKQRIYRSQTGQAGTYLYFIAERAASDDDYTDDVAVDAFQEPLPSADWNAPPDDLTGLIALPNGMMAAFAGRKLYFSEPWRPHAWPEKYVLTTEADIVAIGAVGTTVVVATKGQPQLVVGTTPDTMQMTKIEVNFPCINGRGLVDLGYAIAYPSHEGLVVVTADGNAVLATKNLFNRTDWQKLSPSTMVAAQHDGRYFAFYSKTEDDRIDAGAILIDVGGAFLVRSATKSDAAFYDIENSALYYLQPGSGTVMRYGEGANQSFYWRSKQFIVPDPKNFGAILVDSDTKMTPADISAAEAAAEAIAADNATLIAAGSILGDLNSAPLNTVPFAGDKLAVVPWVDTISVGILADGKRIFDLMATNVPVRMPSGFKARRWEVEVFGTRPVTQIVLGETMNDIKSTL